jgi:hypothetical protein
MIDGLVGWIPLFRGWRIWPWISRTLEINITFIIMRLGRDHSLLCSCRMWHTVMQNSSSHGTHMLKCVGRMCQNGRMSLTKFHGRLVGCLFSHDRNVTSKTFFFFFEIANLGCEVRTEVYNFTNRSNSNLQLDDHMGRSEVMLHCPHIRVIYQLLIQLRQPKVLDTLVHANATDIYSHEIPCILHNFHSWFRVKTPC